MSWTERIWRRVGMLGFAWRNPALWEAVLNDVHAVAMRNADLEVRYNALVEVLVDRKLLTRKEFIDILMAHLHDRRVEEATAKASAN